MYIILVYDIKMDKEGNKILRNVFKICKKYLVHIQDSTFEGELSDAQLLKLKNELKFYLRNDADSCIVFKSRSEKWLDKDFWGKKENKVTKFL
mgnify:CR=1 FL=1